MRIQTLKGNFVAYNYKDNRDYTVITVRFFRNTSIALDYLVKHSTLTITYIDDGETKRVDIIDVLVADVVNNITIIPAQKNAYSPKYNTDIF